MTVSSAEAATSGVLPDAVAPSTPRWPRTACPRPPPQRPQRAPRRPSRRRRYRRRRSPARRSRCPRAREQARPAASTTSTCPPASMPWAISASRTRGGRGAARLDVADLHEHAAAGRVQLRQERPRLAPREGHDRHALGGAERHPLGLLEVQHEVDGERPVGDAAQVGDLAPQLVGLHPRGRDARPARRRRPRRGSSSCPAAPPIGACMTPNRVPSTAFMPSGWRAARRTARCAAAAASLPLLPTAPPARATACSCVFAVMTPNATGTPVSSATSVQPRAASAQTNVKCGVSPWITQPRQITAA